jgi:hypothetical protein
MVGWSGIGLSGAWWAVVGGGRAGEQHQPTDQPDEDQIDQPQRHGR